GNPAHRGYASGNQYQVGMSDRDMSAVAELIRETLIDYEKEIWYRDVFTLFLDLVTSRFELAK
ncbi:MAG: hypothetical protein WCK09_21930, partial [Bacteroidota bacterium]